MPSQTHVRPLPAAVRARLDKLMLMLGSVNDNERASAAGLRFAGFPSYQPP